MRYLIKYILSICVFLILTQGVLVSQDTERPLAPELNLVSVDGASTYTNLEWSQGGSPDVAGYVLYLYVDGEGDAFDTIYNPNALSYTHTKNYASIYSVEYVVAAIDSSNNVSPLSNSLNTIFIEGALDTCGHKIDLSWNAYKDFPLDFEEYIIEISRDGSAFTFLASNSKNDTSYSYTDFETASLYCFRIAARLEEEKTAGSNYFCIETNIKKPPEWINGDCSTIDRAQINLSFTFDPNSELRLFRIEKSNNINGPYKEVGELYSVNDSFTFEDSFSHDSIFYYRAAALNSCLTAVRFSNPVTSLNLKAERDGREIEIYWPEYRKYNGELEEYQLFRINGETTSLLTSYARGDTVFRENISTFSYTLVDDKVCYKVIAKEINNPYIISSESISETTCVELEAGIYVPNAFTPNTDGINDYFYPKLSFTPTLYKLIVTNKNGIRLFETNNYIEYWDGTSGGQILQPDVYLWFLELTTPGGKNIFRKGTISILFN